MKDVNAIKGLKVTIIWDGESHIDKVKQIFIEDVVYYDKERDGKFDS